MLARAWAAASPCLRSAVSRGSTRSVLALWTESIGWTSIVVFRDYQRIVDEFGLASTRPGAPKEVKIGAPVLLQSSAHGGRELYDVPIELAAKAWVDIEAFVAAYIKALDVHAATHEGTLDADRLWASLDEARRIVAERQDTWRN